MQMRPLKKMRLAVRSSGRKTKRRGRGPRETKTKKMLSILYQRGTKKMLSILYQRAQRRLSMMSPAP
ncbi:hypothetical protein A2398_02810 [Candidatus Peribacteria bacterium RIFOXYB1_FULL_57_12]|nr:MAG: hypothetical protein A2398_02810 [Candidatus Peribacteria bacterium RIFOXYB1_FULL_57_12]